MTTMTRTKSKTIDGVTFSNTHSGQKQRYGDSFYEYEVTSERPASEVEAVCAEHVYKAMPKAQYDAEYKANPTASNHFRLHYTFRKTGEGRYSYSVCSPYAD